MSVLSRLLDIDESLCNYSLAQLEKMTGNSGVDIKLLADLFENAHHVMRKLGLDPADTTGHELYASLNSYVKNSHFDSDIFDNTDYVIILLDDVYISFNLIDIVENIHHELPFRKGVIAHARRSLTGELIRRYVDHSRTDGDSVVEISQKMGITD